MQALKPFAFFLNHPTLTDLCMQGKDSFFADFGSGWEAQSPLFHSDEALKGWALSLLTELGKTWNAQSPFVDATLPSGHRLHLVFPPISPQGLLVSLRRLSRASSGVEGRWSRTASSRGLYQHLVSVIQRGESVIISGATGSGKTTLASDLLSHISPKERLILLEDTPELAPAHPHYLSLISRPANPDGFGEISLRTLLRQTLRMRPDRIILGECRGDEVLDLLQALNTGHSGALATLHANSPREALKRIEVLCLLASHSLPLGVIRDLLALGIHWLVQVNRKEIEAIWKMEGKEGETLLLRPWGK